MKKVYLDIKTGTELKMVGSEEFFAVARLLWKLGVYDWLGVRNAEDHKQVVILFSRRVQ